MLISIRDVSKSYKVGEIQTDALKNINLNVEQGEFVVILGPSGSGKSTLLHVSGGLDEVNQGEILVNGQQITNMTSSQLTCFRRQELGFVFQQYNLMPNMTVLENVEVGARLSQNHLDVHEVLKEVMLEEYVGQFPYQLSGGQQQRVAIARAIAKNPSILFCDEPTGALDYHTSKDILQLIEDVNKKYGNTTIIVTHNDAIKDMADRVIYLHDGRIRENIKNTHKIPAKDLNW